MKYGCLTYQILCETVLFYAALLNEEEEVLYSRKPYRFEYNSMTKKIMFV